MKIFSKAAAFCLVVVHALLADANIDILDGKCDLTFVECESVCEFSCSADSRVLEMKSWLDHPGIASVIEWSHVSANELRQVDRDYHKANISNHLRLAYSTGHNSGRADLHPPSASHQARLQTYVEFAQKDPSLITWPCKDHCRYECMQHVVRTRGQEGYNMKFFGKWPFRRVFIFQELLSSLFSILNALPYIFLALSSTFRSKASSFYQIYTLIAIVVWIASAIFHARDTTLTMYFDYFSAFAGVVANCTLAVNETVLAPPRSSTSRSIAIMFMFTCWCCHCLYLALVKFDFDYHMAVSVSVATIGYSLWIRYYVVNRYVRPHAWMLVPATLCLFPLLVLFELSDFAPGPSGLIDAHACWHLSTIPISGLWGVFMYKEAQWSHHQRRLKLERRKDS